MADPFELLDRVEVRLNPAGETELHGLPDDRPLASMLDVLLSARGGQADLLWSGIHDQIAISLDLAGVKYSGDDEDVFLWDVAGNERHVDPGAFMRLMTRWWDAIHPNSDVGATPTPEGQ